MLAISLTIACSRYTWWCYSSHTSCSWWITQSTQHHRRGCNNIPLLFTTNHTDCTFFVWRLKSARSSHPGHSTILLRSEIPIGMRAKLRTVAASNNRDHARNLSYYCLLGLHIWWCYSSRTSCSWWITQSTQHHRRGCNNSNGSASCDEICAFHWFLAPALIGWLRDIPWWAPACITVVLHLLWDACWCTDSVSSGV